MGANQRFPFMREWEDMADEFDVLRDRWKDLLTGSGADPDDPDYGAVIARVTTAAQGRWDAMNRSAGRAYLWSDMQGDAVSAYLTEAYNRLRTMALAYNTVGSPLYGDAALRADVVSGLDWMYANRFNEQQTAP